ncbi:hypothetical protein [Kitasatospora mediocidica]|uniref:hypothetical protein n=1 Tax=Kitasatospora mediocidica TaxID=58352 RepID=UPI0012F92978|nr:hypothetical protein [Kitasatospora mediocidica]
MGRQRKRVTVVGGTERELPAQPVLPVLPEWTVLNRVLMLALGLATLSLTVALAAQLPRTFGAADRYYTAVPCSETVSVSCLSTQAYQVADANFGRTDNWVRISAGPPGEPPALTVPRTLRLDARPSAAITRLSADGSPLGLLAA